MVDRLDPDELSPFHDAGKCEHGIYLHVSINYE